MKIRSAQACSSLLVFTVLRKARASSPSVKHFIAFLSLELKPDKLLRSWVPVLLRWPSELSINRTSLPSFIKSAPSSYYSSISSTRSTLSSSPGRYDCLIASSICSLFTSWLEMLRGEMEDETPPSFATMLSTIFLQLTSWSTKRLLLTAGFFYFFRWTWCSSFAASFSDEWQLRGAFLLEEFSAAIRGLIECIYYSS